MAKRYANIRGLNVRLVKASKGKTLVEVFAEEKRRKGDSSKPAF
jgi:hypothetical protein